jgi:hypothetical protein
MAGSGSDALWVREEGRMGRMQLRALEAVWMQQAACVRRRRRRQLQELDEHPAAGMPELWQSLSLAPWSPPARCPAARAGRFAGRRQSAPPP